MNSHIIREVELYNCLLKTLRQSLHRIQAHQTGHLLGEDYKEVLFQILRNEVPSEWLVKCYQIAQGMNLSQFLENLNQRITFIQKWVKAKGFLD